MKKNCGCRQERAERFKRKHGKLRVYVENDREAVQEASGVPQALHSERKMALIFWMSLQAAWMKQVLHYMLMQE